MALTRGPRSIAGKLVAATSVGAVAGGVPVLALDPMAPFAVWASSLLAGIGAVAAGTGVGAGLAVGGLRRRGLPRPRVLEVLAAAVVGGAVTSSALTAISFIPVVVGGVLAAVLCAGLTWWLNRQPDAVDSAQLIL